MPAKLQDMFKNPDGSKLLDSPLTMRIEEFPDAPKTIESNGKSIQLFDVKLSYQGTILEWGLSADQKARIFTKTSKEDGSVYWQAKVGDIVNISYKSNKSNPSRPYFAAELAKDGDSFVSSPEIQEAAVQNASAGRKGFQAGKAAFESQRFDDAPQRVSNFRAGYCAYLSALLANPQVNPFDSQQLADAEKLAQVLLLKGREVGAQLAAEYPEA